MYALVQFSMNLVLLLIIKKLRDEETGTSWSHVTSA